MSSSGPAERGPSCRAALSDWRGAEPAAALAGSPGLSALRCAHQGHIAAAPHLPGSTHTARDFQHPVPVAPFSTQEARREG